MPDKIDDLRRRVEQDPASIAFAQLGEEYRRVGRYQEAVSVCRGGLAVHPGYLAARVTLGRALIQLSQLAEAQSELDHVVQIAPRNLAAIRGLAEIHHRRGALAEAILQYRLALSLAPNDPELERNISDLSRALARITDAQDHMSAAQELVALQQWLTAIYVTRAQRSA